MYEYILKENLCEEAANSINDFIFLFILFMIFFHPSRTVLAFPVWLKNTK